MFLAQAASPLDDPRRRPSALCALSPAGYDPPAGALTRSRSTQSSLTLHTDEGAARTWNAESTVFVLDGDPAVRVSLSRIIEDAGWEARLFDCATEFLACPPAQGPSCLILDVTLPDLDGLEVQARVVARDHANVPIIFITGHADVTTSVRAMKAGAVEFMTKPFNDGVVARTIDAALKRSLATIRDQAALDALRSRYASLSRRERQVMNLVVSGLLNKQVGGELGISEITVKAHRARVMDKMQARSLAALVRMSGPLQIDSRV